MDKNAEILNKQKRQSQLKKEVQDIKKKLPSFIIGFIFFVAVSLYFFEQKFYEFFGNSVNFIIAIVIFLCLFSLFFVFRSYRIIKKKEKEAKTLGSQLYHLMKLEVAPKNE
jgi:predicted membrane channel-forming protein YqfA (hemolysin III family)